MQRKLYFKSSKADEMMLDCNSMKSCILKIYHEANITRGYFAVFSLLDI